MDQEKNDAEIENKTEETAAEEAVKPKPQKRSFLQILFNPDSRFGRFNRLVTRWIALVLVLFTAGLLVAYLALVKPAQSEVQSLKAGLEQSEARLASVQGSLDSKTRAFNDASERIGDITGKLKDATQHIALLKLTNKVLSGWVELANNKEDEARKLLLEARVLLLDFAPVLQAFEKDLDTTLLARLDLALAEMKQNPKTASADLNILTNYLLDLEDKLFPVTP